jgi:hypothetical protein
VTADAQLRVADVELADVRINEVQLITPTASTGVGEAQVPAPSPVAIRALPRGRGRPDPGPRRGRRCATSALTFSPTRSTLVTKAAAGAARTHLCRP